MAFVPGSKYDIFISYAHIDNVPLDDAAEGWVSTFVKNLTNFTSRKLGSKEKELQVWMDYKLQGNERVTPAILSALKESATLVVLVSPGYLNSDWCRREREKFLEYQKGEKSPECKKEETFLEHLRERLDADSRLFLVELDEVKKEEYPDYPEEFTELLGYRF